MKSLLELRNNCFQIFLFHGVIKKKKFKVRNYNNKHLLEDHFYKILKKLKSKGNALSMDEVVFIKKNNQKFPKKSFVITFDDGFENNYSIAAPVLDDLNIPATFYFSTDFIDNNTMSWIDKIEYCFESDKKLRSLEINDFGNFDISTIEKKIKCLEIIRTKVKSNFNINTEILVKKIFKYFNLEMINNSNNEIDKKINWKKTNLLKNNKLFTLGGHSHFHMPLTYFSKKGAVIQISKSIKLFKNNTNITLKHYSYPEGQKKIIIKI